MIIQNVSIIFILKNDKFVKVQIVLLILLDVLCLLLLDFICDKSITDIDKFFFIFLILLEIS